MTNDAAAQILLRIKAHNGLTEDEKKQVIEAIGKQIPSRPDITEETGKYFERIRQYWCPDCENEIVTEDAFCPSCGRAINWSEVF